MKRAENGPLDPEMKDALDLWAHEQRALAAPSEVEDRVMRAWDDAHRTTWRAGGSVSHTRDLLAIAATGVLAAALGYWWMAGGSEPTVAPTSEPAVAASWPSDDSLVWLGDADPASLQVVRIRVASTALAAHGYAVGDPDGDGLVDVEMVVGTDGIAQSVRLTAATVVE